MIQLNWQPGLTLEHLEELAIKQAYKFYQGNKSATSRALDISVRTLEAKLEKYDADESKHRDGVEAANRRDENFLRRQRGLPELTAGDFAQRGLDSKLADDAAQEHTEFVERSKGITQAASLNRAGSEAGVRVQSIANAESKHAVPVPQRKEVQEVPSKPASGSHSGKRR